MRDVDDRIENLRVCQVNRDIVEKLQAQLECALQIVAALVLTDDEVIEIQKAADGGARRENLRGWAEMMKADLLANRPELVAALRAHGFLTNTHAGFPLGGLEGPLPNPFDLADASILLEAKLRAHARGEGEDVPLESYTAHWTSALVQAGTDPRAAEAVMDHGGRMSALEAGMLRLLTKAQKRKEEQRTE